MELVISGQVTSTGKPDGLANARVELWEAGANASRPVAVAAVRRGGAFSVVVPARILAALRERQDALDVRLDYQGSAVRLEVPVSWRPGDRTQGLVLHALLDANGRDVAGARTVRGRITANGRPAAKVLVRAFDRDLRSEQPLGEAWTDREGRYAIAYSSSQFARDEKAAADLALRVIAPDEQTVLHEPRIEDIVFNAGSDERVDIRLTGDIPPAQPEFDLLARQIGKLAADIGLDQLAEDETHRDVSFLAREMNVAGVKIEHFVLAQRMAALSDVDPAVFYALLRLNTLLPTDAVPSLDTRFALGIADDARRLLLRAALVDPQRILANVARAVDLAIVGRKANQAVKAALAALRKLREEAERAKEAEAAVEIIDLLEPLALQPERLDQLLGLLQRGGDFDDRVAALVRDWQQPPRGAKPRRARREPKSKAAAAPAAATRLYEHIRKRTLHVGQPKPTLKILADHPDLDLLGTNLDQFFRDKKLDQPAHHHALADLKRVQRVARLAPDLDKTVALIGHSLHSAADIVGTGRTRFLEHVAPAAGLSPAEAAATFAKAETRHAAATLLAGELHTLTGAAPAAAQSPLSLTAAAALMDRFPNLNSLFGAQSLCACADFRSVFSPAAYLVELLVFLGRRSMVDLTQTPPAHVNHARDELFSRRGDIADIDLDCANAMTPLPYIDLVCELLEEEVAPDPGVAHAGAVGPGLIPPALLATLRAAGWRIGAKAIVQPADLNGDMILRDTGLTAKLHATGANAWTVRRLRQTHASAEELNAAPEYVNAQAYAKLAAANFAFTLPFDLNHAEASACFSRFGLPRARLMADFATGGAASDVGVAAETLGLTDAKRALVSLADPAGQGAIWSLPPATVVADMAVVETMLDKTGLAYGALDRLLQLDFIDPAGTLFIRHLDMSCDLTQKEIAGLDADALDRIHRFLRLQRAVGWTDTVLDAAITQAGAAVGVIGDGVIIRLAQLVRLSARTGLTPAELTACFGVIPHKRLTGTSEPSFYETVFLAKAVLGHVEEGLRVEAVGAGGTIAPLAPALATLLKLSAAEFELLRAALTDDNLTFPNLSRLFGAARLLARTRLKAADFLILKRRTGIDPFLAPDKMLAFLDHLDHNRGGPLAIAELPFVLEHAGPGVAAGAVSDSRIVSLLQQLQAGYQASLAANRRTVETGASAEELRTPIKQALLRLPAFTEDNATAILRMYDGHWSSPPDAPAASVLTALLLPFFDVTAVVAAQAGVAAAAPAGLDAARLIMAQVLLDAISAALRANQDSATLTEALAAFTKKPAEMVDVVLAHARLRQPGPATPLLRDLLRDDALIDLAHQPPVPPVISEAQFPDQFAAVRLFAKIMPLADACKLSVDDLDWVMAHAREMGWFALDDLPYAAAHAPVGQDAWERTARAVALFHAFPPVPDPADPATAITFADTLSLVLPGAATTRPKWLDKVSLVTGYDRQTLDDLDTLFGWSAANLDSWRLPESWERLNACVADLATINATVAQAVAYAKPALTPDDSAALKTALKARYDDAIWLTTLAEISDAIRPQKRDALVAYLLATHDEWQTPTDLYDHFLIDTQMESKVDSSRIVQAHGAIQLFVERSRMGLEPTAAADTADLGWEQWTWMRNFQVWVANRKVFVNPENWIEPELLDDKSYLFQALEDSLLQNEVNEQTTEDAFVQYLEMLDEISFLEVITVYYQDDARTMHIFARTKGGDPAQYFHRKLVKERSWSPWERVELDITSDTLLAFVRNHRLHLAWPIISKETDPDQEATTPGVSQSPSTSPMQGAAARLKIQLATSEYTRTGWKPRKISQDAVVSPVGYTTNPRELETTGFNLMYQQFSDQILLFRTRLDSDNEFHILDGVFSVTGCKGYPEVIPVTTSLRDFFPDYKDSLLAQQRYREQGLDKADTLAIRNMITFWDFVVRLDATPGWFRVSHPHQFTLIDMGYLLLEYWFAHASGSMVAGRDRRVKLPLGTWLPYFFEDSDHAYVVVPGLYPRDGELDNARTFSDFLQLLEDILALVVKYLLILNATPAPDPKLVLQKLKADPDFIHIRDEIDIYRKLEFREQFRNLYHPLICRLRTKLYQSGVGAMMTREQQLMQTDFDFEAHFKPTTIVAFPYPVEDVDFSPQGSYSLYNWELFFHAPLMIAKRLASEQRFEEAMVWYHRIFDPTGTLDGSSPQKYWVTKPFFLTTDADYSAQRIDTLLTRLADPADPQRHALQLAVEAWRDKPFRPHVVAHYRTTAYQRTVVMNYVGTLIDWGDYLFRQDTMEAITQATQLYLLADKLLGAKPRIVPPSVEVSAQTYLQLASQLDPFGNALVELENLLPDLSGLPEGGAELPPPPVTLSSLYFCVPPNEKALAVWDTVADRLFKIRNSQNIDGVERALSLFAPPIDPGMLVRAVAGGLDLASVIAGLSAPLPAYRFQTMVRKAGELAEQVRALGSALLEALEKKDGEVLALLRNDLEVQLLRAQRELKQMEIESSKAQIDVLKRTRDVTDERHKFYAAYQSMNANEKLNLDKMGESQDYQKDAAIVRATGAVLGIIPDFAVGAHGVGGSPALHASFGGSTLAHVADAAATVLSIMSGVTSFEASRAGILAGLDRRADDAGLQERLAALEIKQIDQQIAAAELRREIAVKDLAVHDLSIANARQVSDTLRAKYTNSQLYQWMVDDITKVYYRAYQLAFETARKAERCYQHELGSAETFLAFGYWDSRKKGLQAASKLTLDLNRMQSRYLEANSREYELTRHISLRQLDPLALERLRTTGICDFNIPEALYDMDHPGHYFRRVRTIAVTLPCVAGPYASVSARLTQISNRYRRTTDPAPGAATPKEAYEEAAGTDSRFVYNVGASQSVATSSGQNDPGLFQLDFNDERYLPFEGTGAIGQWRLELPDALRQFDYATIADMVLHVRYTAREGGSTLKGLANASLVARLQEIRQDLGKTGLHLMVDVRREMYDAWHELKSKGTTTIAIGSNRLPYFLGPLAPTVSSASVLARVIGAPAAYPVTIDGAALSLNYSGGLRLNLNNTGGIGLDTPVVLTIAPAKVAALEDLVLVLKIDTP